MPENSPKLSTLLMIVTESRILNIPSPLISTRSINVGVDDILA